MNLFVKLNKNKIKLNLKYVLVINKYIANVIHTYISLLTLLCLRKGTGSIRNLTLNGVKLEN